MKRRITFKTESTTVRTYTLVTEDDSISAEAIFWMDDDQLSELTEVAAVDMAEPYGEELRAGSFQSEDLP